MLQVRVADGDTVEAGQVVCIVEAMKMENEVTAHRSGVVADLAIAVGQPVTLAKRSARSTRRYNERLWRRERVRAHACGERQAEEQQQVACRRRPQSVFGNTTRALLARTPQSTGLYSPRSASSPASAAGRSSSSRGKSSGSPMKLATAIIVSPRRISANACEMPPKALFTRIAARMITSQPITPRARASAKRERDDEDDHALRGAGDADGQHRETTARAR